MQKNGNLFNYGTLFFLLDCVYYVGPNNRLARNLWWGKRKKCCPMDIVSLYICVARCIKQCQIRRNQSKRSLIDYLTMLSGSKAAFRTNFLQERSFTLSAKKGNLLNYGTLFFLLDSGTSLTCIKKIRLNLFLFQSKEKLAQLWRALLCTWLIHTKIGKEPLQPPTQSPEKLVSVPSFELSLLCWYVFFCRNLSPLQARSFFEF